MAWSEGYPINFAVDGDTTAEAIAKFINELDAVYTLLNRVRNLDLGAVAPSDPEADALWVDTSATDIVLKYYTGSAWTSVLTMASISGLSDALSDVDSALALKAPLSSPALTGVPTAPTASVGTNTTQVATTAYTKTEIQAMIDAGTIDHADYATSTDGGTVKFRVTSGVLYIRTDGTDA